MVEQEWVKIEKDTYIYRVQHRIMEGDCQMDHGPKSVTLNPFYASKYAVTNHMYYQFLQESGYEPQEKHNYLKHWKDGKYLKGQEDFPVVNISYDDANTYAKFYGYRLPSEEEWQYMASGQNHNKWPWGNEKDYSRCNVYTGILEKVDSRDEGISPFGMHHMCGNVWEFVGEKMKDGDGDHYFIVLRGGSCYSGEHYWHIESGAIPNDSHLKVHLLGMGMDRYETVGFRCVKEVQE